MALPVFPQMISVLLGWLTHKIRLDGFGWNEVCQLAQPIKVRGFKRLFFLQMPYQLYQLWVGQFIKTKCLAKKKKYFQLSTISYRKYKKTTNMFLYYFQKVSTINYFSPKVQQNNKSVFKLFFLKNFQPSPIFEQNNKNILIFFSSFNLNRR